MSTTSLFQTNSIFSFLNARSCMIFEARSSSRRWITYTFDANFVRNVASSIAESPPPTTAITRSRKKNPSQVAQYETPRPDSRDSPSMPILRGAEPVAKMTASASWLPPLPRVTFFTGPSMSSSTTSSYSTSAPNRSACSCILAIRSGPMIASGNPGKFSTSVVFISSPPASTELATTSGFRFARAA